jgi:hypothetical protein
MSSMTSCHLHGLEGYQGLPKVVSKHPAQLAVRPEKAVTNRYQRYLDSTYTKCELIAII